MSGGSYNYAYTHVVDMADSLRVEGNCHAGPPPLRKLFQEHLRDVAAAMQAIEWNDSCDGDDREVELITRCLGGRLAEGSVDRVIEQAESALAAIKDLRAALSRKAPP